MIKTVRLIALGAALLAATQARAAMGPNAVGPNAMGPNAADTGRTLGDEGMRRIDWNQVVHGVRVVGVRLPDAR